MGRTFAQLPPFPLLFSLALCFLSLPHYHHIVPTDDEDYQVDPDYGDFTYEEQRLLNVWEFNQDHQRWVPVAKLALPEDKGDQVYTVTWAPNIGRPYEVIATATCKGIAKWHIGLNPDPDGRLLVDKVALLLSHDGGVCGEDVVDHQEIFGTHEFQSIQNNAKEKLNIDDVSIDTLALSF